MKVHRAELLTSCAKAGDFPPPGPPEIAFLGRSNVGKSSLLNKLVQRKKLARTSSTPGKTRLIHFFDIAGAGPDLRMVDLPGYGYAKVSRKERASWQILIESYLERRDPLRAAIVLQDVRRDISEDESLLVDWLTERGIACLVAITKTDKLKPMRRAKRIRELKDQLELPPECVIATSAQTGDGLNALWRAILDRASAASTG